MDPELLAILTAALGYLRAQCRGPCREAGQDRTAPCGCVARYAVLSRLCAYRSAVTSEALAAGSAILRVEAAREEPKH